jgi:hypothetical protein
MSQARPGFVLPTPYFFLLGRCVKVLAAADFADFDAFGLLSVFAAFDAAALLVTFVLPVWARALPAALLAALLAFGFDNVFDAFEATVLLVFSLFFAMIYVPSMG